MSTLDLFHWAHFFGLVGIEVCVIAALAWACAYFCKSGAWRRVVWQVALICSLLVIGIQVVGGGRALGTWLFAKSLPSDPVRVRATVAPSGSFLPPRATEPTTAPSETQESPDLPENVWWPAILWLGGVGIILGRTLFAHGVFRALRSKRQQVVESELSERVKSLALKLGINRRVRVYELQSVSGPIAFGIYRPSVGIPFGFTQNFTAQQQDAMLTHELAHLHARDPLWYLLANIVTAIFWWHPASWWMRRELHRASEFAADESVVLLENGPLTLAECLVTFGRQLTATRPFNGLGVGGFRSNLGKRVERLLQLRRDVFPLLGSWKQTGVRALATLGLVMGLTLTVGWMGDRDVIPGKDLGSTIRRSWQGSMAALTLAALDQSQSREVTVSTAVVAATAPEITEKPNVPVLIVATFYSLEPGVLQQLGISEAVEMRGREAMKEFEAELRRLKIEKDSSPRVTTGDGVEARMAILRQGSSHGVTNDSGILLNVTPTIQADSVVLDLEILKGEFGKNNELLPGGVSNAARVAFAPGEVGLLNLSPLAPTNLLVVISAEVQSPEDREKIYKDGEKMRKRPRASDLPPATQSKSAEPSQPPKSSSQLVPARTPSTPASATAGEGKFHTRNYKVDVSTMAASLKKLRAELKESDRKNDNEIIMHLFAKSAGVEFKPPMALFYNDQTGALIVRASLQDLDLIEQAVVYLNTAAPQVKIVARFAEMDETLTKNGGLKRLFGEDFFIGPTTNVPAVSVAGIEVENSTGISRSGILTSTEYKAVLDHLEKQPGIDVLSAPAVTTLSGRQAQVSVLDIRTVVTGLEKVKGPNGVFTNTFITKEVPCGPVLDVVPFVSADNQSVHMTVKGTLTEFIDYQKASRALQKASPDAALPLPRLRVRQIETAAHVGDGQTMVLGGLLADSVLKPESRVPFMGSGRASGTLFQMGPSKKKTRNLFIFVTPTIVDPTGKSRNERAHDDAARAR